MQELRNHPVKLLFTTAASSRHTGEWDQLKLCNRVPRTAISRIWKTIFKSLFRKGSKQECLTKATSPK